eukprot:3382225-Pyramimonas_sp.AAC.1
MLGDGSHGAREANPHHGRGRGSHARISAPFWQSKGVPIGPDRGAHTFGGAWCRELPSHTEYTTHQSYNLHGADDHHSI